MGSTSTAVKRRYNEKTYRRWTVDLRHADFERAEALRGGMSRAQFLSALIECYEKSLEDRRSENEPCPCIQNNPDKEMQPCSQDRHDMS